MKTLFLTAISLVFVGSAAAAGPHDFYMSAAATADVEDAASDIGANAGNSAVSVSDAQAARDAADDLEVARLMAEAPDDGDFGDSVIVDKTGAEVRISAIGFIDK